MSAPSKSQLHLIPDWQKNIWKFCAAALMSMIFALLLLVAYTFPKIIELLQSKPDNAFVFAGMSIINAGLLRLLAILIGGAIAFVGLAVSFFTHQKTTSVNANTTGGPAGDAKIALATNSPGIAAVIIGAVVIIAALLSKGTYTYGPDYESGQGKAMPEPPPPRSEVLRDDGTNSAPK